MRSLISFQNTAELMLPEEVSLFCGDTFSIGTNMAFDFQMQGKQVKTLHKEWNHCKCFTLQGGGFRLEHVSRMARNPSVCVSEDFEHAYVEGYYPKMGYHMQRSLSELLLDVYRNKCVLADGAIAHAAAVVYKGQAILFAGIPGAGKSTQASLWEKHVEGTWMLNCDHPAIVPYDNVYYACGTPWSGKETCYVNRSVPIKAIVFVKKAPNNSLRRLKPAEAFATIYPNFMFVPMNEQIESRYINVVTDFAPHIPTYELSCTISEEAVKIVKKELYEQGEEKYED